MKISLLVFFRSILGLKFYEPPKSQPPYWADPRIHMFGNDNWFHANVAPIFTTALDQCVYKDSLRSHICKKYLLPCLPASNATILDIGCGAGLSTEALANSFKSCRVIGIDTSAEMLKVASRRKQSSNIQYELGNGHYYELEQIDVSFISFMFHEVPQQARISMLQRLSHSVQTVVVLDICQDYTPSKQMLFGEPYLYDYLENIDFDIKKSFRHVFKYVVVPKHATLWIATNQDSAWIQRLQT
tara:strand:- start:12733 stop:13461 length:729 start_codon:yes stop_codon:yes gene_type:complete